MAQPNGISNGKQEQNLPTVTVQEDLSDPPGTTVPNGILSKNDFYELIGMIEPHDLGSKLQAASNGLYAIITSKERSTNAKYLLYEIGAYFLLGLQLLLSAVFVILGSLKNVDSHLAIAVLGAVSTVSAGILALMKGQGQPTRLRQTRIGLRRVIFEAKELEWDVRGNKGVTFGDIYNLRKRYLDVLKTDEMNQPDFWVSTAQRNAGVVAKETGPGHVGTDEV